MLLWMTLVLGLGGCSSGTPSGTDTKKGDPSDEEDETNSNSDTDADADGDADSDGDGDSDSDTDTDSDGDSVETEGHDPPSSDDSDSGEVADSESDRPAVSDTSSEVSQDTATAGNDTTADAYTSPADFDRISRRFSISLNTIAYLDNDGRIQTTGGSLRETPPDRSLRTFTIDLELNAGIGDDGEIHLWPELTETDASYKDARYYTVEAIYKGILALREDGRIVVLCDYCDPGSLQPPEGEFVDFNGGGLTWCAVTPFGALQCWGENTNTYEGSYRYVSISGDNICALTTANGVDCVTGGIAFPSGQYQFVSAGPAAVCAVTTEGGIVCEGEGRLGRLAPPDGDWVQVQISDDAACALSVDGSVTCWGSGAGDGASVLDCHQHSTVMEGTLAGEPWSMSQGASYVAINGADKEKGFQLMYALSDGWLYLEGDDAVGGTQLTDGQAVTVDRAMLYHGGIWYCAGSGEASFSVDEMHLSLSGLVSMGGYEDGTPVQDGHVSNNAYFVASDTYNIHLDDIDDEWVSIESFAGSGVRVLSNGDLIVPEVEEIGDAEEDMTYYEGSLLYFSSDAIYYSSTVLEAGQADGFEFEFGNFYRLECPATAGSTDAISGCVRQ